MKKTIVVILFAILIGCLGAFYFFKKDDAFIKSVSGEMDNYTFFQIGVFTNIDNANALAEKNNGIVIKDKEYYRVIISILYSPSSIIKMKNYLDNNKINYYLKEYGVVDKEFINELNTYESIIIETNEESAFLEANNKILDKYVSEGLNVN